MTQKEVSERYGVPASVLREYERWSLGGGKGAGARRYDDGDLERLSIVMTLRDTGFTPEETEAYMRLLERPDSEKQRLRMVERRRSAALEEIHFRERQLARLDYLRHDIQTNKK